MADGTLTITGKDVKIELLLNGVPAKLVDSVESFTENAQYQNVESRYLGTANVDIDQIPDGWAGEIEVGRRNRDLDDIITTYNAARRNRIPSMIIITSTKYFWDGTSVTHTYPDCKITPSTESRRGSTVKTRLSWRTGLERF